jgi:hypothetical protein
MTFTVNYTITSIAHIEKDATEKALAGRPMASPYPVGSPAEYCWLKAYQAALQNREEVAI